MVLKLVCLMCSHKRRMPPHHLLVLTHLVIDKFSVCDCGTGCSGSDTMGLMLTQFCLPATPPLATPSLRMIWVPGVMGVLAGGRELYTLLMSAPL